MSYKSPLHQTVTTTASDYWNDSCAVAELTYAMAHGATGATSNPAIVLEVLKQEMHLWRDRIPEIIAARPTASEVEIAWAIIEEMAVNGARTLQPIFDRENGLKGRLSLQTDPTLYRNPDAILDQAVRFDGLAPNMQVKIPATAAGILAIEEATCRGVNINATVSFTVPQAIAVAEAVERGLRRREADGLPTDRMTPVCTIMIGRLDDWLQVLIKRDGTVAHPGHIHWAGVAAIKRAYEVYLERGFRTRLLAAAYRHHLHWSELIGGDLIMTMTHDWQLRINASKVLVKERMQEPVDPAIVAELRDRFPDFRKAYDEDGLAVAEFDTFGPCVRTLRTFISAYHDLLAVVRDFMLPDPDVKREGPP